MKRLLLIALTSFFASNAFAAADWVLELQGKYTFDILKNSTVRSLVKQTLIATSPSSNKALGEILLQDLEESLGVAGPSKLVDGRFLVASGCQPHNCGSGNRAMFVIDAENSNALLIVRKNTNVLASGNPWPEAFAYLASGEWAQSFGGDFSRLPAELQQAIKDL